MTGRKFKDEFAMTGEMTLKGLVIPVGGIRLKCIGAFNQGMK